MNRVHSKSFLNTILILLLLASISNASNTPNPEFEQEYSISQLNHLILSNLNHNRIVMLSDSYHGHGFFMMKVTKFLEHWMDQIKTNQQNIPEKIILFLEVEKKVTDEINEYIKTGTLSSFLEFYIEYDLIEKSNLYTLDYLIFVNELKRIKQGAEKLGADLKIVGAEPKNPYSLEAISKMSKKEYFQKKTDYFVSKRDKLILNNITSILSKNPDYKALIFYGDAHLGRKETNKNIYRQNNKEMKGYYLAHYLDSVYTKKNVCIFLDHPVFNFEYEKILKNTENEELPNYFVSIRPYPFNPLSISFAFSKNYLEAIYSLLQKYETKNSKIDREIYRELANKYSSLVMHTYLSDEIQKKKNPDKMIKQVLAKSENILEQYNSLEAIKHCIEYLSVNPIKDPLYPKELTNMLTNIPSVGQNFDQSRAFRKNEITSYTHDKMIASKAEIQTYLAINLLFIANSKEKAEIIQYLNNKLNLNYDTEFEWYSWWRSQYLPKQSSN